MCSTRGPVKITMTGPQMLAKVAYDDYYNDLPRMMDLSKLLRRNFRLLAAAGCRNLQIGESLFRMSDDWEVDAAVGAIDTAIEGLPDDIHVSMHLCQGHYVAGTEYDERTIITSSCGFNHLPRQSAMRGTMAMTEAKRLPGG
jgi:5-methyltetrahydropteroyltriglutamate--homocysteine methyltransferase